MSRSFASLPRSLATAPMGSSSPAISVSGSSKRRSPGSPSVSTCEGVPTPCGINYRTSHQIRNQADRLLDPEIADVDGNTESRRNAVSVFNGPEPEVRLFKDEAGEIAAIGEWIRARLDEGVVPEEIGVFVR